MVLVKKRTTRRAAAKNASERPGLRGEVVEVFRRAILDAAERVFGAHGLADTKMSDVAREAGVASGTLYNYFDSKEAIFRALFNQRGDEVSARLRAIAAEGGQTRERLLRMVRTTYEHIEGHAGLFAAVSNLGGPVMDANMKRVAGPCLEKRHCDVLDSFAKVIDEGLADGELKSSISARDLAVLFAGSASGVMRTWLIEGRKGRIVPKAPMVVDVFFNGVSAKR